MNEYFSPMPMNFVFDRFTFYWIFLFLSLVIEGPRLCNSSINVVIPSTQIAIKGYPAILKCSYELDMVDDVIDITWKFVTGDMQNQPQNLVLRNISQTERYSLVGDSFGDASLGIESVVEDDAGLYVCTVVGRSSGSKSVTTTLELQWNSAPYITQEPRGKLQTGNGIILTCMTDAQPLPIIKWSANNSANTTNYNIEGAYLSIVNLTREDNGTEIRCSSRNKASFLTSNPHILQVMYGPEVVLSVSENTLTCEVDAFPVATIILHKNRSENYDIVIGSYIKTYIDKCEEVTCNATNSVSSASRTRIFCGTVQESADNLNLNTGLGGGALAGIVVTVIAVSLLIVGIVVRKKRNAFKYMRPTQRTDLDW